MKAMWVPAAAVAFLTFCTPGDQQQDRTGEFGDQTGMAGGADTTAAATMDTATPGGADTAAMAPAGGAMSDADVLSRLAVANQTEIQSAQFAAKQARNPEVREFAQTLEKDHQTNLQRGQSLMQQIGAQPSEEAREEAAKNVEDADLAGKSGAEFDRAFVDYQIDLHEETIQKVRNELLPAAQSPELRTFLQNTIPVLEQHLAMARQLETQLER